jgi:hypothetical protein
MLSTKDSSRPVVGSVRVRNAWCGRFAVLPSVVVRSSFKVSVAPNETALGNEAMGLSLQLETRLAQFIQDIKRGKLTFPLRLHRRLRLLVEQSRWHPQNSMKKQQRPRRRPKAAKRGEKSEEVS